MILSAKTREQRGRKNNKLRKDGLIPAVLYGKGLENIFLTLDYRDFERAYKKFGESSIFGIKLENEKEPRSILIQGISEDPVTSKFVHIDFYQIRMDEKLKVKIPLVFKGESGAVKDFGGVLVKNIHEVEVEAFPKDLPHEISVDISSLKTFEDVIHLKNLELPAGVSLTHGADDIIALVTPPRSEEELASLKEEIVESVEGVKVETEEKKLEREKEKEAKKEPQE